jgi:hypothetical protein|nr:hypothetical protein Q903MT_gene1941 [Picea sitchensis]
MILLGALDVSRLGARVVQAREQCWIVLVGTECQQDTLSPNYLRLEERRK